MQRSWFSSPYNIRALLKALYDYPEVGSYGDHRLTDGNWGFGAQKQAQGPSTGSGVDWTELALPPLGPAPGRLPDREARAGSKKWGTRPDLSSAADLGEGVGEEGGAWPERW